MRIPSLYIAEELMPFIRARIAERLYSKGMKQGEIARYLGTTQTMVSKYLAGNYKSPPSDVRKILEPVIDEVAEFLALGGDKAEGIAMLSKKLMDMMKSEALCRDYAKYAGVSKEACLRILRQETERFNVLHSLQLAVNRISELMAPLIPEVRSNFVYSIEDPKNFNDVAAIPGRITAVGGRAFALPPEFGASKFMAGLIIRISKTRKDVRSAINIKYDERIEKALKKAGLKVMRVKTGGMSREEAIERIVRTFLGTDSDAVIDEGGEGVEPLVYIFGRNPMEVVDKIKRILEVME